MTIHRVTDRSSLVAVCGANLATPGHLSGGASMDPVRLPGETTCGRGCYAQHRAEGITSEQIRLRDMSRPLTPGRHVAGVAA